MPAYFLKHRQFFYVVFLRANEVRKKPTTLKNPLHKIFLNICYIKPLAKSKIEHLICSDRACRDL